MIEFGPTDDEPTAPSRRRWHPSGLLRSMAGDRRVVPVAAALGGVALFASLVSEWQITMIDGTDFFRSAVAGPQPVPTDLVDLGGWGAGYLIGLFALVTATVLMLFGPPPGRRYARLVGLSTGGVLLGLLAALEPTLDDVSRTLGYLIRYQFEAGQVQMSSGRGVWCAIAGVALVMAALILAGRHLGPETEIEALEETTEDVEEPAAVWSWRRPESSEEDSPPEEPYGLTVSSTRPFTSLNNDNRDKAD